jgi:hypothetical protein
VRLFEQMMTLSFARCAQRSSSNLASPETQERTRIPSRSKSGSIPHRSPAMLYSPMRFTSYAVVNGGSAVPITRSRSSSPASRLPMFLSPMKPGVFTGTTGIGTSAPAARHTASTSSPVMAVTQVA